jgi:hypothetical protein
MSFYCTFHYLTTHLIQPSTLVLRITCRLDAYVYYIYQLNMQLSEEISIGAAGG